MAAVGEPIGGWPWVRAASIGEGPGEAVATVDASLGKELWELAVVVKVPFEGGPLV